MTGIHLLKRLFKGFIRPYLSKLIISIIAMIVVAVANAFQVWLVKPALDKIFFHLNKEMLTIIPVAMVVVGVLKAFGTYFQNFYIRFVGQRIITDIQSKLYSHLIYSDLPYLQKFSTGKIISRFSNDIITMRTSLSNVLTGIAKEFLTVVFLIIVMFNLNWQLAILIFGIFPLAIYPIIRMGKKMRKISLSTQESLGHYTSQLDETFKAIKEVKSYHAEKYEIEKSNSILDNIFELYVKAIRTESLASPIIEIISSIAIAGVIWYAGYEVIAGKSSPGSVIAFIGAFVAAYRPLKSLAELNNNLQEGLAASKRLFDVLDVKPEIIDHPQCKKLKITKAAISFNNISFSYKKQLFNNLSFNISPGKVIAFVGSSGSGKTTIANLLLRFYEIESGEILIDGQNIQQVSLESLRSQITMVSQDILLFDDTVAANISYGKQRATKKEIIAASKLSAAEEFIIHLPQGYDTMIGQSGFKLSGGQKQRLSIARAILKGSPIIIFDEATSALDNISEAIIQNSVFDLKKEGRSIIIIAHRLSTIINSDLIYVLDKGKIIDSGTHKELLNKSSYYRELYSKSQNEI
ncbi:MAG: ABC transporter ATP-binding protein/permease [Rickettsiales bacterium]|nr:ABC transporter ATP-binding protein/permease [Rickettsiales bacterium]